MSINPIDSFLQLLSYKTVSLEGPTNGAYSACVQFLESLCQSLQLKTTVISPIKDKPILMAEWRGSQETRDNKRAQILLNSHYDVVPCELDKWNTDPFKPTIIDGKIFARGTQDMKCVCI